MRRVSVQPRNPDRRSKMGDVAFRSHLTRALDPRSPSNVAISGLTLLAAAAGGVIALTADRTLWLPILAGGRDLHLVGPGPGTRPRSPMPPGCSRRSLPAPSPCSGSTSASWSRPRPCVRPPRRRDHRAAATAGRPGGDGGRCQRCLLHRPGWVFGFGLAIAIYLDDRMADFHKNQATVAAIGAAVGASLVATLTDAFPESLPPIRPPLTLALGILALIAVLRDPLDPVSLVDSRKKTPLRRGSAACGPHPDRATRLLRLPGRKRRHHRRSHGGPDPGVGAGVGGTGTAATAAGGKFGSMCRSIKVLREGSVAAPPEEIEAAARQFVRKISGFSKPAAHNVEAFEEAVHEIAHVSSICWSRWRSRSAASA